MKNDAVNSHVNFPKCTNFHYDALSFEGRQLLQLLSKLGLRLISFYPRSSFYFLFTSHLRVSREKVSVNIFQIGKMPTKSDERDITLHPTLL